MEGRQGVVGRRRDGGSPGLELLADIEAASIRPALSAVAWTIRGRRNRVFVLVSGASTLTYESTALPLVGPCVIWLPGGRQAALKISAGARGATLAIPELTLGRATPLGPISQQVRSLSIRPLLGAKVDRQTAQAVSRAIETIEQEVIEDRPGSQDAVRHHLAIILIHLWRISSPTPAEPRSGPRALAREFVQLVELHVRDHWGVADYAERLGIPRRRLNSTVRRVTGRSPLSLIHAKLVAEAEILLDGSNLHVAEVADALGFKDPGYFSRFFKRETGSSPGRYRRESWVRKSRASRSFAAWP